MKTALVCADGIGDALIASIAAHNLRKVGHNITVFSSHLPKFGKFLESGDYLPMATNWKEALAPFDAVILQHEDTKRAKEIKSFRNNGLNLYIIYTNYRTSKHGPLLPGFDYPVDETKPMVYNVCKAMEELFHLTPTSQNCLEPSLPLLHRKYIKRVLIHPTSTREDKNWLKSRFLKLAKKIERNGLEPIFIVSPEERKDWPNAPLFSTLEELTKTIYESGFLVGNDSGPVHIASYYQIPHLVICQGRQMPLWSPGWYKPEIIRPPKWVPNLKGMRLRENQWKYFISTNQVLRSLRELQNENPVIINP
ncbi:MAG TPA: glycosyltransferase family 9 protein [Chlamydiales bacterium]|nr:glycosyltransferase family 9 protein [Chlamydiales bacterium]